MTDDRLDDLMASMAPITEPQAAGLPLSGPEADLLEAIMSDNRGEPVEPGSDEDDTDTVKGTGVVQLKGRRPRHRRGRVLAAAAVAAAVLLTTFAWQQQRDTEEGRAWAAELVEMAETSPRLLLDRPGWSITRADQYDAEQGEMTFEGDGRELGLYWIDRSELEDRIVDREHSAEPLDDHQVVGQTAKVMRYDGTQSYLAIWTLGDHTLEARIDDDSAEGFLDLLDGLQLVDVDTWLGAMPASVVKPDGKAAAVDEMLADIPQPSGFDASDLKAGDRVQDRYQLGAQVSGAVTCAWIEQWITATDAGDGARVKEAVDAMATSHDWAILVEMNAEGDYPEVVWELADAMATDAPVAGGRPMTIRESYSEGLGCAGR
jgi:hypothetical protein